MSRLTDRIIGFEHYKKEFDTWEATENIIDQRKAVWILKKPGSEIQKVCLYRDGCNMFVYGDYGQFTFDRMTWLGDVYNLQFDNIGYQMEKLNYESRKSLYEFDDDECKKDIKDWLKDRLEADCDKPEELVEKIFKLVEDTFYLASYEIDEFCQSNDCYELHKLISFVNDCLNNVDEHEWIGFLRNSNLDEFDEPCDCRLWEAGTRISQRYFICMYALKVCGEKLKLSKEDANETNII